MNWTYLKEEITSIDQFPKDIMGFVYILTHLPSKKVYVGKKFLVFTQKRKLAKRDLKAYEGQPGRKPKYKVVSKESDWKDYWSSNKEIKKLLEKEPKSNFTRQIVHLCKSKKQLTYFETKYQFLYEVLEKSDKFFNDNILGKFYYTDFGNIK
jgi:hypothetical protein